MELHQLRYLRAVVQTGSVTAAAEAEHVAQPSVSKQIRLLERELGTPLFHRVGRRVVPTEAGLTLAECAARVLDELQAAALAVAGPGSAAAGRLRLCATETVTDCLLPAALAAFREEHPTAQVSVEMLGTDDALARVLDDSVDFAIVVLPLADSRLVVHPFLREEVKLALPLGHRWARRKGVSIREALTEPNLLLSMPGHGLRAQLEQVAHELGVALRASVELRSQQALLAMVAAQGGIAFAPGMSLRSRDDVLALSVTPRLEREIGWVCRRGRHLPLLAFALLGFLGADQASAPPLPTGFDSR